MGRTKSLPAKNRNSQENWSSNGPSFSSPRKQSKEKHSSFNHFNVLQPDGSNFCGKIWIGETNNVLPDITKECKASFITNLENQELLVLHHGESTTIIKITNDVQFIKDIISTKIFSIKFEQNTDQIMASLYFTNLPLKKFNGKIGNMLKIFFNIAYQVGTEVLTDRKKVKLCGPKEIETLYNLIKEERNKNMVIHPNANVQHEFLKPKLRPYQEDAVRWMLQREKTDDSVEEYLHPLYEEITLESSIKVYFDKYTGYLETEKPTISSLRTGGILADEMGLGKTVEVLCCILTHQEPLGTDELLNREKPVVNFEELSSDSEAMPTSTTSKQGNGPVVDGLRASKKRKFKPLEKEEYVVDEPKRIKVPDDWVKSKSKKSANKIALEMWYENILNGTFTKEGLNHPKVHCICGSEVEKGTLVCHRCSKVQHAACLGFNKKYKYYLCPQCWLEEPLIKCRGTLIVCPTSLLMQWIEEICKHISGHLRVLNYQGVNSTPVYPPSLNDYDIVLTTYTVLQSELKLTKDDKTVTLRRHQKYSIPGCPLTRMNWWRLCLDEAQKVEIPSHAVSQMAKMLTARHRWAVTGTPISKSVSDLFGLIDFLQMHPYSEEETWKFLLYDEYIKGNVHPMIRFLSKVLWRTPKKDVLHQINIPAQTVKEHWIEFSDIEKYFYSREHEFSSKEFLRRLKNFDLNTPLKELDKSTFKQLLAPLLSLRQACTHHNAVRGRYLAVRKSVKSMDDLLNALIAKNIVESEEYLRVIVSALNGLAGIYLIIDKPALAVENYRRVLHFNAEYGEEKNDKSVKLTIDILQLVHTMYNLSEVLQIYPNLPPTLHDGSLNEDRLNLEKKYIDKYTNQTMTALEDSLKCTANVNQLQSKFVLKLGEWYSKLINWITIKGLLEDFNKKIFNLLENSANIKKFYFTNERKIFLMVGSWDEDITEMRDKSLELISNLYSMSETEGKLTIPPDVVQLATDCHLRPTKDKKENKKKCPVCITNEELRHYECKLFSMEKKNDESQVLVTGSWKPCTEEYVLRALLAIGKSKGADHSLIKDGENHLALLEAIKVEFKEVRKFWTFIDKQICAKDELDICKIRLKLKEPEGESKERKLNTVLRQLQNEDRNQFEKINVLSEHELHLQEIVLKGELSTNTNKLKKNIGTYNYLQTLRVQQTTGQSIDPCPICKNPLEKRWNILPCGHCFCLECIQMLIGHTAMNSITCSVCRQKQCVLDITMIQNDEKPQQTDNEFEIKGNYSTKMGAVVKLVLKLKREDENVKVLIFSNWLVSLKLLKNVCDANDINAEILQSDKLQRNLKKFKDKDGNVTCLLIPVQLGSQGLNLIEATHVIIIEPFLNPGDELQAIGRVHRIGQTKPTVVHKFLIQNTIEENIHHAVSSDSEKWDKNKVTLNDIKSLFDVQNSDIARFANDEETESDEHRENV